MNPLTSFHRILAVAGAALFLFSLPQQAVAQDDPTSITFTILNTCNNGGFTGIDLQVGGSVVGNIPDDGQCTCTTPLQTFTTSDPAALALADAPGCSNVAAQLLGATYVSWIRAEITRSISGTETICITDTNGGNCDVNNLCTAGYTNYSDTLFVGGAPDSDGDGDPDCSDPDDDNDGVLDAADNCPLVPNPDQVDTNGDGVGNACDALDNDTDNDGIDDPDDNCPADPNPDQADSDGNGTGDICQPLVVAVPWLGNPNSPHQVFSGGTLMLQAASFIPATGEAAPLVSATWDPGDGSGPQGISVANPRALELAHTYAGALGQPFTAIINATDTVGNTYSDTFKVIIAPNTLDTEVNMAKDHGLWRLHKQAQLGTGSNGVSTAKWAALSTSYEEAATAAAVQAFEINGHLEFGDPLENPYVTDVAAGLAYLFDQLATDALSLQGGNDPDGNGNGKGLRARTASNHWNYISGQIMDAIVASGTPAATAVTGSADVLGRRYDDIVQDMIDQYAWGATDLGPRGGWDYTSFNNSGSGGSNDSSASHWWAIGTIAGETWGLDSPQWLKDQNFGEAIPYWQPAPNGSGTDTCPCGYRSQSTLWDGGWNTTAACLIMMNADDVPQDDARFTCAERWIANNFYGAQSGFSGNWYDMFQTKKAMLTAVDAGGAGAPIDLLNGSINWHDEFSQEIVDHQLANGSWDSWSSGIAGGQIRQDMRTAWAVIILTPALFELGPIAACNADPTTAGLDQLVDFDASGSSHQHPDGMIVTWEWDFDDGGTGSGETTTHAFAALGNYSVTVTVTDEGGLSDSTTCAVEVIDTDLPPNANAGGPYEFCDGDAIVFDGSGSTDAESAIALYEWDWTPPVGDFAPADGSGAVVDATGAFAAGGPYDIGLRVTDSDTIPKTNTEFTTVTILEATNPVCNQPPTADAGGAYSGDEGSGVTLDANGSSDPDEDALTYAWTVAGDASCDDLTSPTPTCEWPENGTFEVCVTVDDGELTDSACTTAEIYNVAPAVDAGAGQEIDEDESITLAASFTDPGSLDTHTVEVDWGDGSPLGSSLTDSHQYLDDDPTATPSDTYTVTVTVTDDDGGVGSDTLIVTVNNVAPTVEAGADQEINEDESITLAASFTDPGTLDTHTVDIDWGDGSAHGTSLTDSHQYLDDDPTATPSDTYTVTVTVTDDDTGVGVDTLFVTVNNLAPIVGEITAPIDPVAISDLVCASADFVDLGTADSHTAEWDWGDLTTSAGTVTQGAGFGSVGEDCHSYSEAGVYTIELTVTDDDTGTDSVIYQYVVVYDPSAGFVTGGGWIDSPPGAYIDDPELIGRANFGFVAKYKKGKATPDGSTEFQFQAGDINFHSNEYEWLVVAGAKAMFKGDGTINGEGNFGFLLKAIDEKLTPSTDVDLFSIKIWDKDNGDAVVYDNSLGAADDGDPENELGGGQIVIHKKN